MFIFSVTFHRPTVLKKQRYRESAFQPFQIGHGPADRLIPGATSLHVDLALGPFLIQKSVKLPGVVMVRLRFDQPLGQLTGQFEPALRL